MGMQFSSEAFDRVVPLVYWCRNINSRLGDSTDSKPPFTVICVTALLHQQKKPIPVVQKSNCTTQGVRFGSLDAFSELGIYGVLCCAVWRQLGLMGSAWAVGDNGEMLMVLQGIFQQLQGKPFQEPAITGREVMRRTV